MSRAYTRTKAAQSANIKGHPQVVQVIKRPLTYKDHYLVQRQEINNLNKQAEELKREVLLAQQCAIKDLIDAMRDDYEEQIRDLFYAPVQIVGAVDLPTYMCRKMRRCTDLLDIIRESDAFQDELEHARKHVAFELTLELISIDERRQQLYYTVYPSEIEISEPDSDEVMYELYKNKF